MKPYDKLLHEFSRMIRNDELHPLLDEVIPGGKLKVEDSLRVYQNAYFARMTESLGETFEGVWRILGDDEFFAVCRDYTADNHSASWNISDYGSDFPEYLAAHYPQAPFLREIAEFELVFRDIFHKKASVDTPDYAQLGSPDVKIIFNENFKILKFRTPAYTLWKNRNDDNFTLDDVNMESGETVFIYKAIGNNIYSRVLNDIETIIIQRLMEGYTLNDSLSGIENVSEKDISELFVFLNQSGTIRNIEK